MADIIDSLKRLERIGSENSKTVEKIIVAAGEIEEKILEQYKRRTETVNIDQMTILMRLAKENGCSVKDAAEAIGIVYNPSMPIRYVIAQHGYGEHLFRSEDEPVSKNRDTALAFAKDIANGLLVIIAEDLAYQQRENEQALATLAHARQSLEKQEEEDT